MISRSSIEQGHEFDVIIITAEYYDDHPLSPAGIIARVLDAKGYSVGIIEKPVTKEDFTKLGTPRLFFGVTSGSIDSMLNNYTPLKKKRIEDKHSKTTRMPDRAVIVYCNRLREIFRQCTIVIGGIEASLRRFAHYDYWDNKVRNSILLDSRADILVYGNGEKQVIEIADRISSGSSLKGIRGTCVISKKIDSSDELYSISSLINPSINSSIASSSGSPLDSSLKPCFELLPSFSEVKSDDDTSKKRFCKMQAMLSNNKNLAQEYNNNYVLQYRSPEYTPKDLDWIYSLPFSRKIHQKSLLNMAKFSVITHRGCIGQCNFCALALHQGDKIISRSEKSILDEIGRLTKHPEFKGFIDDLGGPSANMYGMDSCNACTTNNRTNCVSHCIKCSKLDKSHSRLIQLLKKARKIKGIKKIFTRSGIRYDLALESKEYIKEISEHHISGGLKIAPEHFSEKVLRLMNKHSGNPKEQASKFDEFKKYFDSINKSRNQHLTYYFMTGHPGDDVSETEFLKKAIKNRKLKNIEAFQLFTPTPMTISTCMYWTGLNPFTLEKVSVVHDYNTKKRMKRVLLGLLASHWPETPA